MRCGPNSRGNAARSLRASMPSTLTPTARSCCPWSTGRRSCARYRDIYDLYDYPHPVFEIAFHWLEPRMAGAQRQTLVHGDFRHGNLLISPRGVEAALDWELTHIGDPLEDIGWICTNSWRFGVQEKVVGGFGDLADLLAGYEAAGGGRVDRRARCAPGSSTARSNGASCA